MNYAMKIRVSLYIYAFMFTSIFSQYCNIRMKIFDIYYIADKFVVMFIYTYNISYYGYGYSVFECLFYSVCKPIKSPSLVLLYILSMIPKKLYRFQRFDVTIQTGCHLQ